MTKPASRYWASLTDSRPEVWDRLVEQGRRRDLPLWRRYLASLLDVEAVGRGGGAAQAPEQELLERDPPASTVYYTLDRTVAVGTTPPVRRRAWRITGFALAALLVIATAFGVSRLLPGPTLVTPMTPIVPPALPPVGYHMVKDPVGYRLDVPLGWTRAQKEASLTPVVFYDSPDRDRELQIFQISESSPAKSLDLAEKDPSYGFARQPGYAAIQRTSGDNWSELAYYYTPVDEGVTLVIDHRFEAADGTLYAIRSAGLQGVGLDPVREPLDVAVASFCPVDAHCPAV
ncbi:hypothetical protein GCM10022403_066900 [Streptomyces coacervatus]|uniref:Uncharacterized protein n=1 Tax=Streptomyces coacervatus TaxID=647381 RepID=A0ABP7IPZ7_9ACTN|nr:hypothetical protein [Streptomyces coacervatus]MDF2266883.1 hypothetical protein [Streptomyces coacervatus]